MPVMLVFADNDLVLQTHCGVIGSGVKEPEWQNTQLVSSQDAGDAPALAFANSRS